MLEKKLLLIENLGYEYPNEKSNQKKLYAIYKCHCGIEFKAQVPNVKNNNTKSCGCDRINTLTSHGMSKHSIHKVWIDMKSRCNNINHKHFKNWGGRGITICDRWLESFENFRDDMFPTWKQGLSIDRINNDGNYEPSNCRWATNEIQHRNTRILCDRNTSGYRGVSFNKASKMWVMQICVNYIIISKSFNTALEAAIAYDTYVIENNLEHTINGVTK